MISRAEANGLLVIVDAGAVSVKPPAVSGSAALSVTYGTDLMEFSASIDARSQYASVQGASWDVKNQAVVTQASSPQSLNAQGNLDSFDARPGDRVGCVRVKPMRRRRARR